MPSVIIPPPIVQGGPLPPAPANPWSTTGQVGGPTGQVGGPPGTAAVRVPPLPPAEAVSSSDTTNSGEMRDSQDSTDFLPASASGTGEFENSDDSFQQEQISALNSASEGNSTSLREDSTNRAINALQQINNLQSSDVVGGVLDSVLDTLPLKPTKKRKTRHAKSSSEREEKIPRIKKRKKKQPLREFAMRARTSD